MAIDNTLFSRNTESIVLPAKRKFYPADIPIPHHQLRHFISTADKDWIFYASEYDIYSFHKPSQRKRLLITLPFTARCLAAGLGWICAGGQNNGDCAFIKLRGRDDVNVDVDTSLPFDAANLNSKSGQDAAAGPFPDLRPELHLEQFSGEIVNSITLHLMAQEDSSDTPEPLAIISNNDKSIKVFSLLRKQIIMEMVHATSMNYALISPDSTIMAAVGDENHVYFYKMQVKKGQVGFFEGKRLSSYKWKLFAKPSLPSDGNDIDDCCFTATFSPSGHLCAVAAQNGMITVLDVNVLADLGDYDSSEGAVICSFRSSRPRGLTTGAVRSMAFSPAPWDLLLWAEEFGRAGVADVRSCFTRRQIIKLETHAEDIERIQLDDLTDPHLRELDPETRMLHQFRDAIGLDDDDYETRHLLRGSFARTRASGLSFAEAREHLTERERQLIESIRTNSNPEDSVALEHLLTDPRQTPYSVNYTSSPRVRASLAQAQDDNRSRNARLRAVLGQLYRSIDADRPEDRTYQPRRRSSVVLSHSNQSSDRLVTPSETRGTGITASPSRLSSSEMDLDESRPHSVSAALEASGAFASDDTESERPRARSSSRETDLLALLHQQQSELPSIERRIAQQQSELPDLEARLREQQRQLEVMQREMNARIGASSHLGGSRSSLSERSSSDLAGDLTLREIARALEPFDPTGIPPETVGAARERHERRATAAAERARHLRHVLFAGEPSSAQTSALPTVGLVRSSSPSWELGRDQSRLARLAHTLEARRRTEELRSSERDTASRRSSTPSNVLPRNRSQSPTSRALSMARVPTNAAPSISYAEAAESRRRLGNEGPNTSSLRSRPGSNTSTATARPPALSAAIRQARLMAMQNAASRMTDANGNWMAEDIWLNRGGRGSDGIESGSESWSEAGVGTAGVGWSPDGRNLYVGTEEGIFEYALNLADRMTFPGFSFR